MKHEAEDPSSTTVPAECPAQNVFSRSLKGIHDPGWEKDQGQGQDWEVVL